VAGDAPGRGVTRERLNDYATSLALSNAPLTVMTRIRQLGNAMRAMAPDQDWTWILRAADRMRARAIHARDKRSKIVDSSRLAELGIAIMDQADRSSDETAVRRAADYRDGLIIAFLAYRPIRMRNLAMIACGQHLIRSGTGWRLVFTADETKTGQPIEMAFPGDLVDHLERYLAVHRPVLLNVGMRHGRPPTDALWVSSHGQAACASTIAVQVKACTRAAFGQAVNPHLFRDCAATSIALNDPTHARIIAGILGHATLTTSERYYNQAQSVDAGRRYQATIAGLRKSADRVLPSEPDND
jgi:integrase/recombinase XerD